MNPKSPTCFVFNQPVIMLHTCNHSTIETEAGRAWVPSQVWLLDELEASLGYIPRLRKTLCRTREFLLVVVAAAAVFTVCHSVWTHRASQLTNHSAILHLLGLGLSQSPDEQKTGTLSTCLSYSTRSRNRNVRSQSLNKRAPPL